MHRSPTLDALSVSVPSAGLPGADARSSGVSKPWVTALRTRWRTGSIIRSIRYLSISVLLPAQLEAHALPISRARSRTTNGMRRKISPIGTSRTRMTPSRSCAAAGRWSAAFSCIAAPLRRRHLALRLAPGRREPRAADHEIAHATHQLVEPRDLDAHLLRGPRRSACAVAGASFRRRVQAAAADASPMRSTSRAGRRRLSSTDDVGASVTTNTNSMLPSCRRCGMVSRIVPCSAMRRRISVHADRRSTRSRDGRKPTRNVRPPPDGGTGAFPRSSRSPRRERQARLRPARLQLRNRRNGRLAASGGDNLLQPLCALDQRVHALGVNTHVRAGAAREGSFPSRGRAVRPRAARPCPRCP